MTDSLGRISHDGHTLEVTAAVDGYSVGTRWVTIGPPTSHYYLDGEEISAEEAQRWVYRTGHGTAHAAEAEQSVTTPEGLRVYWCGHIEPAQP